MFKPKAEKEFLFDIAIFFLFAVTIISLGSYVAGINELIRDEQRVSGTYQQSSVRAFLDVEPREEGVAYDTDYAVVLSCVREGGDVTNRCLSSDFTGDYVVDEEDGELFAKSAQFDMNNDGEVDLNFSLREGAITDYFIFIDCSILGYDALGCAQADFNGDEVIDELDHTLLLEAGKYDTNANGFIEGF